MSDPTTGPTSPPPYSDHGAPGNTDAARIAAETMRRIAEQAAHEQMRAEFLRDLTDPAQDHAGAPADDRVTDDLRDIIASQSLAMATARTKQGVAAAAVSILAASQGDVLAQAAARGLKTALGGVGDFFEGVDLAGVVRDIAAQAGVVLPVPTPAPPGEAVAVGVQVDGDTVGTVTVPLSATEEGVIAILRGDALLMAKIPAGREVTGVEYLPGKVVRITTAPAAGEAPVEPASASAAGEAP